ncbi:MAG TPA: GTP cyclohydrolase I FolE [Alphaproteobacteria bacterium]|nr:GTP cyclohydrolase I FolE [Alphaproteobacteria bacterium]
MAIKPAARAPARPFSRPAPDEALQALDTLLRYIGEDPSREGLRDTPARVLRAWGEYFSGYAADPEDELTRTFEDIEGYDDMVVVRDIDFHSHCEHHMVPILGKAHVGYWPESKVVGISKLARVVDIHARRLTSQETMTARIARSIDRALSPKGVAIVIRATHFCMSTRGVNKPEASTVTSCFTGIFRDEPDIRLRFLELIR